MKFSKIIAIAALALSTFVPSAYSATLVEYGPINIQCVYPSPFPTLTAGATLTTAGPVKKLLGSAASPQGSTLPLLLDGNQQMDVVVLLGSGQLRLLRDLRLSGPISDTPIDTGGLAVNDVAAGDIDGDGFLDLVVSHSGGVRVGFNNGNAQFSWSTVPINTNIFPFSGSPGLIAIGDMNADGRQDIALSVGDYGVARAFGQPLRQFTTQAPAIFACGTFGIEPCGQINSIQLARVLDPGAANVILTFDGPFGVYDSIDILPRQNSGTIPGFQVGPMLGATQQLINTDSKIDLLALRRDPLNLINILNQNPNSPALGEIRAAPAGTQKITSDNPIVALMAGSGFIYGESWRGCPQYYKTRPSTPVNSIASVVSPNFQVTPRLIAVATGNRIEVYQ